MPDIKTDMTLIPIMLLGRCVLGNEIFRGRRHWDSSIQINDGPGLLLGWMWDDYARLERSHRGKILVATLRMAPERNTSEQLHS
jgi:hypothetical protein